MNDNQQSMFSTLLGKANKAQADLDAQKALYESWKNEGASMRNKLFEDMTPQVDTEKEQKLRDYGKAQAITDFLTSLTTGVIGTASKGYAPQVGANAQRYATDLSALRDINRKKQEAYDQMKAEVEYGAYEKEGQRLAREVEKAERKVEQADNDVFAWQKFEEQQNRTDARQQARSEAQKAIAKIRNAKAAGEKTKTTTIGKYSFNLPKGVIDDLYYYLVERGVPQNTYQDKGQDIAGATIYTTINRAPSTPYHYKQWMEKNIDVIAPHLKELEQFYNSQESSTSYTPQQVGNNTGLNSKTISGW